MSLLALSHASRYSGDSLGAQELLKEASTIAAASNDSALKLRVTEEEAWHRAQKQLDTESVEQFHGAVGWHGNETGTVALAERKLRVRRPRLRKKHSGREGEIPIPAYEAMQREGKLGSRMLEILLRGVSTRQYKRVLPEMAETAGVAKSSVSAEAVAASEEELRQLCGRRWEGEQVA